jgi:hypothetical protein
MMRTLLFGEREIRRPVREVDRVPSLGPHNKKERTTTLGRRETWAQ